jgi:hypothetical protein
VSYSASVGLKDLGIRKGRAHFIADLPLRGWGLVVPWGVEGREKVKGKLCNLLLFSFSF